MPEPVAPPAALTPAEIADLVRAELGRKAGGAEVPASIVDAMVEAKVKTAEARRELADLRASHAAAVPDGARVLSAEEAAAYDALVAGHDTLDAALAARVAASEPARELAALRRREALAAFQTDDGRTVNAAAFDRLDGFKDLGIEDGDDGRPVAVLPDGARVPLADHIAAQDDATRALLLAAPATTSPATAKAPPAAVGVARAAGTAAAAKPGLLAAYMERRQAARQRPAA